MTLSWPAIKKEVRMRMRGKGIFIIENLYVLFLGAVIITVFALSGFKGAGWEVGQQLFGWLATVQILLLVFISPTITASAITLERDQKTYDILRSTPLTPPAILTAKLLACLSTFFVLALVSVPMISVCFVLGGVSPLQAVWTYCVTLVSMLLAGFLGLYLSTIFRRTLASIPVSGVSVIVFLIGTGVLSQFAPFLGMLNPLTAFSLIKGAWMTGYFSTEIPFWVPYLILSLLLCFWLYLQSVENLKPQTKRNFVPSRIVLALLFASVLIGIFSTARFRQKEAEEILQSLGGYASIFFFLIAIAAGCVSSGLLTFNDYFLSRRSRCKRFFSLKGWFGGSPSTGTKFTFLIAFSCFLVLLVGIAGIPMIGRKLSMSLSWFFPAFFFAATISLIGRVVSMKRRTRGRFIPRIITAVILFLILIVPPAVVNHTHRDEVEPQSRSIDTLLFLSPLSSYQATFNSEDFFTAYPFLKKTTSSLPFPLITSLIYLISAAIFFCVSEKQLANLRREEFKLRPGTESL